MMNLNSIDLFVNYCAVGYYNCWTIQFVYIFSNYSDFDNFFFNQFELWLTFLWLVFVLSIWILFLDLYCFSSLRAEAER